MTTIFLQDLGCINALGNGKKEVSHGLFTPPFCSTRETRIPFKSTTFNLSAVTIPLPELPLHLKRYDCRNNQLLLAAYEQIHPQVEEAKQKFGKHRIGIFLGSSTSGIGTGELAFLYHHTHGQFPQEYDYVQQEMGGGSEFLAKLADITGPHYTLSTACSSAGKAITTAARWLQAGLCDVAIAGGSDSLCGLTTLGFNALEALSPTPCNPFSKHRTGMTIGEGAALFLMSKDPSDIALTGIGESSDGYHMTAPDPEGQGAKKAIQQALAMANCRTEDIGYVNLHGTGTEKNDAMESHLMHSLFNNTLCSSSKPQLGHTLGAAAAQELALCWILLNTDYNPQQKLPAHVWDKVQDPQLPPLNFTTENSTWHIP